MKKIESATTWRVVNEDPSESYITLDEEFDKETIDPVSKSVDPVRNRSCENAKSTKQASSVERQSNIKLSVLSAMKKAKSNIYKKQRSTSRILDDIERKISSPLLQHAMSAFFNTTKIPPPPTGPKSIRMSSNASVLYPIREEGGGKMSIDDDILDEADSSPRSSISGNLMKFQKYHF